MSLPLYKNLKEPVLEALTQLGGEAKISDLEKIVADNLHLSGSERKEMHNNNKTKLSYRISWARFALKKEGLIDSSVKRGMCSLSKEGRLRQGLVIY